MQSSARERRRVGEAEVQFRPLHHECQHSRAKLHGIAKVSDASFPRSSVSMTIAASAPTAAMACHQTTQTGSAPRLGELPIGDERAFAYARLPKWTSTRVQQAKLSGLDAAVCVPRDEFQQCESKNKRFSLTSWAWKLTAQGQSVCDLRMVYISGTKNTIINTWAFPYAPHRHAVFAAELIALGDTPKLTFIDIQGPALCPSRLPVIRHATSLVSRAFADLRIPETPPSWAIDASHDEYLFTREMPSALAERIASAYSAMLDKYFQLLIDGTVPLGSSKSYAAVSSEADELDALHHYQLHHMESSPGKVFLSKLFGEQWTHSFLTEFLFCRPGELA